MPPREKAGSMVRVAVERRFGVSVREGFDYITEPPTGPRTGRASSASTPRRAGATAATGHA